MNKLFFVLAGILVMAFCHDTMAATLTVTNLHDSGAGSLRQRVATATPGDTINFVVSGAIALTNGEIFINKNLTIEGPGAPILTISGGNTSRIFRVFTGRVNIAGLTMTQGIAGDGGAIAMTVGTLNLARCVLINNVATRNGGAISARHLNMTNCSVIANHAGTSGGGLALDGSLDLASTLVNCTVSGNVASGSGGGIYSPGFGIIVANSTITGNTAPEGGGFWLAGQGGHQLIGNTIVAGNSTDIGLQSDLRSLGNNLIGRGGSIRLTNGVNGDKVGSLANPIDPKLGPLQNNGGPTPTHALLPGSPAIDMGNPTNAPATDQRGFPRVVDGDNNGSAIIDIGAFEFSNRPPVAQDQTATGKEDTDLLITLNGSDADGDPLTAKISSLPSAGLLYQVRQGPRGPVRGHRIPMRGQIPLPDSSDLVITDPTRRVIYVPNPNRHGTPFDSFQFKVNDLIEDSAAAIVTINIRPVNDRPVARPGPNRVVNEGDMVAFDGSASFDIDHDPLIYHWDFGDGTVGMGVAPSHVYADNGDFFVSLTVRDPSNAAGFGLTRVRVRNLPPLVNAGPDQEEVVGDLVSFMGGFSDPGGRDTHTITWDFGDGTSAAPASLTPTHTYDHYGTYTVRLTVTDDDRGVGMDTATLTLVSAVGYLEQALARLAPHEGAAGQLKEAVKKLQKALDREWIDEVHVSPKDGQEVFHELKGAVDHLSRLLDKGKLGPEALAAVQCAVDYSVRAARLLAETLLAEVDGMMAVDPHRQDKVDKELAKAHDEFKEAEVERRTGAYTKAIESYRKAWEHTTHAEEEASRPLK